MAERLWRTVKYEEGHLKSYTNAAIARKELAVYIRFYNDQRAHQALDYRTPAELLRAYRTAREKETRERRCSERPMLVSCGGAT